MSGSGVTTTLGGYAIVIDNGQAVVSVSLDKKLAQEFKRQLNAVVQDD